jgi:PKD repeat protein
VLHGLTGLPSGLWATVNNAPVPSITASVTIRGYTVAVTARPVHYRWDMGDGDLVVGSSSGTMQAPSVMYTYQTKGTYTVILTVTWAGTYSFSGFGQATTATLPEVAQAPQQVPWSVQEIVSVLVAPGSSDTSTTLPSMPSAC